MRGGLSCRVIKRVWDDSCMQELIIPLIVVYPESGVNFRRVLNDWKKLGSNPKTELYVALWPLFISIEF